MNRPENKTNHEGQYISGYSLIVGPALMFIIGSSLSLIIFFLVQSAEKSKIQSAFEFNARNRLASLQTDIVRHQEMVSAIAGLFSSSQNISRKEFYDFVNDAILRYPSIQGFSWNPLIKKSDYKWFVDQAHEDGFTNFEITELNSNGQIIKAPVRDDYVAVYYIEPYFMNKEVLGFNIASHPGRLKAIEHARDTGLAVITERIKLVQEKEGHHGYLLLKAVYRKGSVHDTVSERRENFSGLAVGVFRFSDWIPLAMREIEPLGIDMWLIDESASDDKQFLHFHSSRTRNETFIPTQHDFELAKKGIHWQTTTDILGRKWTFLFSPSPAFINKHQSWQAWILLAAGLIISILLAIYFFTKTRHSVELEHTNKNLLKALNEIKSLKGIIPICSYCHKIRDDKGAWNQLESYLKKHSDAEFSHGICPSCFDAERKKLLEDTEDT